MRFVTELRLLTHVRFRRHRLKENRLLGATFRRSQDSEIANVDTVCCGVAALSGTTGHESEQFSITRFLTCHSLFNPATVAWAMLPL